MSPLELHSRHEGLGARFGELGGNEAVLGYADVASECRAARDACALVDLSARDLLQVTGPDRATFLHGMVTNDVNGLAVGGVTYAAMLTVKGAMVADLRLVRRQEDLLLDLEPGLGPKALEFLGKYLISEDAELADVSRTWGRLGLLGPKTGEVLQAALGLGTPASGAFQAGSWEGHEVLAWESPLAGALGGGVELLLPLASLGPVFDRLREVGGALGLRPLGFEALETLRVESGVPRYGQDMVDTTLPLEANLERALHYNKGCYIGQEVIARATFRGHMNRKLVGLLLGNALPPALAELRMGERKVGWVTSVLHSPSLGQNVALGYVHRDFLTPGTTLELAGPGTPATVTALPFVGNPAS